MSEYLTPGVYVEEISSGSKPIPDVGTSTGAFVGIAEQGPINKAELVTNWIEYQAKFGGFVQGAYMPLAVYHFFNEGGSRCWVVRANPHTEGIAGATKTPLKFHDLTNNAPFLVKASPLRNRIHSSRIRVEDGDNEPYTFYSSIECGLQAFDTVDNINILAIPDAMGSADIMAAGIRYCESRADCFFVVDSPEGLTPEAVCTLKESAYLSKFGALYYPWIHVDNPLDNLGGTIMIPPSGVVVGMISRTDTIHGVHKAPAGMTASKLRGIIKLERQLTMVDQDILCCRGINVLRNFNGPDICVWGAKTVSPDPEWKYINVCRLFLMVKKSLEKGTQWVVFEQSDQYLWANVRRNITAFLTSIWRSGAFLGSTTDEAFYVKVDSCNNPPEVRDDGRLIIEVGIAPVKPAEFVIIRIQQKVLKKE